ncbi:hypothetical protein SYNPS1DRAFT_28508, partial [Syncephalis pseudoplumigaleata]
MACQRPNICRLPALVLRQLFAFLDDDSLLMLLSSCHHLLAAVDEDDDEWQDWFKKRFGEDSGTIQWMQWHDRALALASSIEEEVGAAHSSASDNCWIRRCIGRLCLEKNWRNGADSVTEYDVSETAFLSAPEAPKLHIMSSNLWGTLVITNKKHTYYISHQPPHEPLFVAALIGSFLETSYDEITSTSNERYIVMFVSSKDANANVTKQHIVYWRLDNLELIRPYHNLTVVSSTARINDLAGDWLLLQDTPLASKACSAYIVNLTHPIPIVVKTEACWNTYTITETTKDICTIYAGSLAQGPEYGSIIYSWHMLRASLIDVRQFTAQKPISIPLRISKQGEYHSRLLSPNVIMVWHVPSHGADEEEERAYSSYSNRSSPYHARHASRFTALSNSFFVHDVNTNTLHYSGTFSGHTPVVSFHKQRIIMLNGLTLKLIDLSTKQTLFESTIASGLIHVGFVLD